MIERRSAWYDIYDERGKKQKDSSTKLENVFDNSKTHKGVLYINDSC